MIIGNPSVFAIESMITTAYSTLSFRALGFFVIHVQGIQYGVREPDASMLACSIDEVASRIADRGKHTASFASEVDPHNIAKTYYERFYGSGVADNNFGISDDEFEKQILSHEIVWIPDGDAAFDDGTHVLHFDVDNSVRLIAFKSASNIEYDLPSLRDIWLPADVFYEILETWHSEFYREWLFLDKADSETGPSKHTR